MPDFMNPSEDLIAGLTAGRNEKQDEVDALSEEIDRLTSALTALREAVKAWDRYEQQPMPEFDQGEIVEKLEERESARDHMLRLANATTTGDTNDTSK